MNEPITSTMLSKYIILSVMSVIGGVVHALHAYRGGETKGALDFIALAFVSGFGGLMFGLLSIHYLPHDTVLLAFASGMGGFVGTEGLAFLVTVIKTKVQ